MPPKAVRARPKSGGGADFHTSDAGPSRSPRTTKTTTTMASPSQSNKRKSTAPAGRVGKQPAAKKPRPSNIQRKSHITYIYTYNRSNRNFKIYTNSNIRHSRRPNPHRPAPPLQARNRGPQRNPQIPTLVRPAPPQTALCAPCARSRSRPATGRSGRRAALAVARHPGAPGSRRGVSGASV